MRFHNCQAPLLQEADAWVVSKKNSRGLNSPKDLEEKESHRQTVVTTAVLPENSRGKGFFACFQKVLVKFGFLHWNAITLQPRFLFVHLSRCFHINF